MSKKELPYKVECIQKPSKPGCWDILDIRILQTQEDGTEKHIGTYERQYGSFGKETFFPFRLNGKDYALFSADYTSTRVMSLPDCKDLGGEASDSYGFCPVEFYVPQKEKTGEFYPFGFIAGCIWGDDSSWKIQFLDLSQADKGIIKREERFGYIELPDQMSLKQAITIDDWEGDEDLRIHIARQEMYRINRKDLKTSFYWNSDIFNDVMQMIKFHGLNDFKKTVKHQYNWFKKNNIEFTEDQEKFIKMLDEEKKE